MMKRLFTPFLLLALAAPPAARAQQSGVRVTPEGRRITKVVVNRFSAMERLEEKIKSFDARDPRIAAMRKVIADYKSARLVESQGYKDLQGLDIRRATPQQRQRLIELLERQESEFNRFLTDVQAVEGQIEDAIDPAGIQMKRVLLGDLVELMRAPFEGLKDFLKSKLDELQSYLASREDLPPSKADPIGDLIRADGADAGLARREDARKLERHLGQVHERAELNDAVMQIRGPHDMLEVFNEKNERTQLKTLVTKTLNVLHHPKPLRDPRDCDLPPPPAPPGAAGPLLNLESPDSLLCKAPGKLQFENLFSRNPPAPSASSVAVSRSCIVAAMKSFPDRGMRYVNCPGNVTTNGGRPCVTENYVNNVHSAFSKVSECLGLSQRDLLPILANESGLHVNVRGPSSDIGIGQLTPSAIKDVNEHFSRLLAEATSDPRCIALRSVSTVSHRETAGGNFCPLAQAPENPLRNMLYAGMVVRRNEEIVTSMMSRANLMPLLQKAGLAHEWPGIRKMIETLGYNAGAGTAVILLRRYVDGKLKADPGFARQAARWFNFADEEQVKPFAKRRCDEVGSSIGFGELTFPQYVRMCQPVGTKGYLNHVHKNKRKFEQWVPNGRCVPDRYLQL